MVLSYEQLIVRNQQLLALATEIRERCREMSEGAVRTKREAQQMTQRATAMNRSAAAHCNAWITEARDSLRP